MHYTNILALMDARNVKDLNVDRLLKQVEENDTDSIILLHAIARFQYAELALEDAIKTLKEVHA